MKGENMQISIFDTPKLLGIAAAKEIAEVLNKNIAEKGEANLLLSTGKSQFYTIEALIKEDVDWSKVTMFHLDEYVNLHKTHPASFIKYLEERFVSKVPLGNAVFVQGEGDAKVNVEKLNKLMQGKIIDIGVIGIGENAHIAFNDPPADFECDDAYKIVNLDDRCKMQQVGEGWFATIDDVPKQAISMTVKQIMRCTKIVSPVPYAVKAEAIRNTLLEDISPMVPATKLREHPDCTLYLDKDSAKKIDIIGGKVIGK